MIPTKPQHRYIGRFAPSPTGPLHAGSLVAALASWLDARALKGRWLVRMEDVDSPRSVEGADLTIMRQLAQCGLFPDEPPVYQSRRSALYVRKLGQLHSQGWVYPCGCSRKAIAAALEAQGRVAARHTELAYTGTCRHGVHGKPATATRVRTTVSVSSDEPVTIQWNDRRLGAQQQDLTLAVGDFVLKRADGLFTYQMAVVVDDAEQAVTHIVRGEDLADNTPRQIHLQRVFGFATPKYLHTPLVLGENGEKLSKQNGAAALELDDPLPALHAAAQTLGLQLDAPADTTLSDWLHRATQAWAKQWHDRCP
nr:tRNA glutamyl-Q(34) synthetase GluQRS [uncultured Roseateles sp.]